MKKDTAEKAGKYPTLDALKKASKGLQFVSETEAPFEVFRWQDRNELTQDRMRQLTAAGASTPVEAMSLDDFFRAVPSEDKVNFQKLEKALKDQLAGVQVYKLGGEAEKQVYIVGKTPDGQWAGLKTTVVET